MIVKSFDRLLPGAVLPSGHRHFPSVAMETHVVQVDARLYHVVQTVDSFLQIILLTHCASFSH